MNIFSLAASRAAAKAVNEQLHKPRRGDGNTVHLPKLMLIIGIICTTVFLIPAVWIVFFEKDLMGLAFFGGSLLSSSLIVAYINQRIYYDSEGFTAKSFFGIKRRYSYSDIEYSLGKIPSDLDAVIDDENFDDIDYVLDLMTEDIRLMAKGKKILIDQIAVGGIEFLAFAQKQYKLRNGGRPIPDADKKSKLDAVFNGNVKNPGAQIFVDVLVYFLAGFVIVVGFVSNVPTKMDELEFRNITAQSYEASDEDIYFDIDGFETQPYISGYKDIVEDYTDFLARLSSGESFKIGYNAIVDDGVTEYRIEYIEDDKGRVYTTPEAFHEYYQKDFRMIMLVMLLCVAAWTGYVVFSIYVGRNPHKFSEKLVHKIFKPGTIRL